MHPSPYASPPPPPPPPDFAPPKANSNKALAALVLGCVGLVGGFACGFPVLLAVFGLVLGIVGVLETGRNGLYAGRGIAIAAVVVNSVVIVAVVGVILFFVAIGSRQMNEAVADRSERVGHDVALLVERLSQYSAGNDGRLGPGGPFLGAPANMSETVTDRSAAVVDVEGVEDGRVVGELRISHLVRPGELRYDPNMQRYELVITGRNTASIRIFDWGGTPLADVFITNAAAGAYHAQYHNP